ncbi:MAG: hypothetical protein AVDCRST_MAG14-173 [uncultured Rubrobacteraceae bacterium]|uniref:Uncharacterized protein n=1 Tax=uncultured Rubrobacteraceae bacterium TaxID=349277 RepID=A0A6J4QGH1_9ACTN|nr:MAG: hypothetical protein AVDCRST_MAG14-173 [uncultured Rubrobacteraceae bacterium]
MQSQQAEREEELGGDEQVGVRATEHDEATLHDPHRAAQQRRQSTPADQV